MHNELDKSDNNNNNNKEAEKSNMSNRLSVEKAGAEETRETEETGHWTEYRDIVLGFSVSFVWSTVSGRRFLPPGDGLALTKLQPSGAWFVQIYAPQPGTGGWERLPGRHKGYQLYDRGVQRERERERQRMHGIKSTSRSLCLAFSLSLSHLLTRSISRPKSFQTLQARGGRRNGRDRPEVN